MSGVGFWELMLVFLIGLVVLGPERLPRVAHQLGTWLGQARRMTRMMKRQLEEELNLEQEFDLRPRARPLPRTTRTAEPPPQERHPPAPEAAPAAPPGDAAVDTAASGGHEPHADAAPDEPVHKGVS